MPKIDFQEDQIIIKNNGLNPYTITITKEWENYTIKKNNDIVIQTHGEAPKLEAKNILLRNIKWRRGDYFLSLMHEDTKISLWSKREINWWLFSFRTAGAFYNKEIDQIAKFLWQEHPVHQGNRSKRFLKQLINIIILTLIVAIIVAWVIQHRDYIMMLAEKYEWTW